MQCNMNKQIKKISSLLLSIPTLFTLNLNINAMHAGLFKSWESVNYDDHGKRASKLRSYLEKKLDYKIGKELGKGLTGIVYLATDKDGKEVALKFTRSDAHIVGRKAEEVKRYLGDIDLYNKLKEKKLI